MEEGLCWAELQEVIQAITAAKQQQHGLVIYTAAQYGLKWEEYDIDKHSMRELTCETPRNV